jgi:hypothetical protein
VSTKPNRAMDPTGLSWVAHRGFIEQNHSPGTEATVRVSAMGKEFLTECRHIVYGPSCDENPNQTLQATRRRTPRV